MGNKEIVGFDRIGYLRGFPDDTNGKEPDVRDVGFYPWVGKVAWRRKWQPTPVFLPGESHGQRNMAGFKVHRVAKSRTQLSTRALSLYL